MGMYNFLGQDRGQARHLHAAVGIKCMRAFALQPIGFALSPLTERPRTIVSMVRLVGGEEGSVGSEAGSAFPSSVRLRVRSSLLSR